jgi:hypothetical protein
MLELSKTKKTHQLGTSFYLLLLFFSFYFYFSISSVLDVLIAVLVPYFIQQMPNSESGRKVINFYLEKRETGPSSGENKNTRKNKLYHMVR